MTPKVLLDRAIQIAGWAPSDSGKRTEALSWLNIAKGLFVSYQGIRWDFLYTKTTLAVTSAASSYSLPATISEVYHFWNVTDDKPMHRRTPEWLIATDPDEDMTGSPEFWIPLGFSASSGAWSIRVFYTPDGNYTLGYFGFLNPADFTDQDTTDLNLLGFPAWTQPALMHWTAEFMLQAEGMVDDATTQERLKEKIIASLVARNRGMNGGGNFRLGRRDESQALSLNVFEIDT